ncbi:unnamed protein product [Angiostrongylus costaricensis]|uniref:Set apart in position or space protein n=1 Tax=Angiostrongylus costaricensis TaxID=334426 RepID=A0A0R3PNR8_ANGCS|nr:unnamed protein product [Angiostrongylus costaricensis]
MWGAAEKCCESNDTEIRIFVLLARRINTTSNQVITSDDLTTFGDGLREAYGLDAEQCRNYILILGVELAKKIYVWTGSDVVFPEGRMNMSVNLRRSMFLEKNYMEGLNKIVDEIGDVLVDLIQVEEHCRKRNLNKERELKKGIVASRSCRMFASDIGSTSACCLVVDITIQNRRFISIQDSSTAITLSDRIFNFTVTTPIENTTASLRETFSTPT